MGGLKCVVDCSYYRVIGSVHQLSRAGGKLDSSLLLSISVTLVTFDLGFQVPQKVDDDGR